MKELIALTVLLFAQRAVGQCVDGIVFEYGFEDKSVSTLMGAQYTYCISAVCGSSPSAFTFNVRRSYESELPDQVTVFMDAVMIPDGFDPMDDPICITATADDNDCLDSGDTILLEIQDPTNPPDNVRVADGCDSIGVQSLDNDVIGFVIKDEESIIQASQGDDTAEVCVHIAGVQAPTKRSAVLLFILDPEMGLAQLQKKIGFIPEGTESGDKVCCTFDLNDNRDIDDGEFVDLSVRVISQDTNVYGNNVMATIRVNGGADCGVAFVGNTPNVTGSQVVVELTPCVTSATCTVTGTSMPCGGGVRTTFIVNRNTRVGINVVVNTPVIASPLSISRNVRRDIGRCDSHLLNVGFISLGGGDYTMQFEGTGGVGGVNNRFVCTVTYPGITNPVPDTNCPTRMNEYDFTVPPGSSFCVSVNPNPDDPMSLADSCDGENTRTFCGP